MAAPTVNLHEVTYLPGNCQHPAQEFAGVTIQAHEEMQMRMARRRTPLGPFGLVGIRSSRSQTRAARDRRARCLALPQGASDRFR